MTKTHQSNKEAKKQPSLSLKEKRTVRKAKKDSKDGLPPFPANSGR